MDSSCLPQVWFKTNLWNSLNYESDNTPDYLLKEVGNHIEMKHTKIETKDYIDFLHKDHSTSPLPSLNSEYPAEEEWRSTDREHTTLPTVTSKVS